MTARVHAETCDHDGAHPGLDCATASRLQRLVAFAEAVRDEIHCDGLPMVLAAADMGDEARADLLAAHRDDCFHCAAVEALEGAR